MVDSKVSSFGTFVMQEFSRTLVLALEHKTSEVSPREGTRPTGFCRPGPLPRRCGLMALCIAAGLIASGCKEKTKSQPPSASALEPQPSSPMPEAAPPADVSANAKTTLDTVNSALNKHDLESATVSLVNLGLSGQLSDGERAAYQSSMRNLQAQLAEAAARNDPKANEMIQLLRASRRK